ncbi:similar to Saccharomyces cerevisiae YNL021W HDA1 Putative catalytic subunit of a class II histone deacetylase complex that also contains Hda2p and Hda3p [Maudiozyma barnettii]|uniref:Histone deacetylase n=1 Tax=Maudiozyma barnettii TaxID=61262 RepID=A0A8H2ZGI8_9SACH|nr:histone deacetylase HDA1 [Kazachstania barnettii]CAB4252800.1 similar to Saccharomyces cerevisiae YNL021W HDA1 Putative catalytic subunit of a class II histone deacetylase complex that also contains Hda2p and Hda3p [Kazachstania barnettii]CAD1780590.1 similar to Saccharomyces cerevisiae YNL021W HDA1 Putative catalytic subunit of a class II histone deacetylase complex that also contains Hda2p and Hda3p [Kazachstania barnettii]
MSTVENTAVKREFEETSDESVAINNNNGNLMKRQVIVPVTKPRIHYTPLKTGLCYDVKMRYHAKIFTSYFEYIDPHPEDPRRIYRIYKILAENGLINDPMLSGVDEIGDLMLKIPVREATRSEILEVHSKEHLDFLEKTEQMSREELLKETEKGDSVYYNNDSLSSAKSSCGGAIEACKSVVEGRVKNALAVVRPPGHHSEPESSGGFCLFSNVAVAAKNILKSYPESVRRIMILDWDIHHGNGTQKAFYNDDRVLYVSLHRFELGKYYPGTVHGQYDQTGEGKGEGFNCNITWPIGNVGDAEYMWAFEQIVMPMGREFQPDLVIISSGFDAADGDTIGQCHVTPSCYGHMTHMLKSLARGNLAVILEGGYNLDSIAKSALAVAKVLVGEPPDELPEPSKDTKPEALEMVDKIIRLQSKYWKCFKRNCGNAGCEFKEPVTENIISKNFPLQTAIRQQQLQNLLLDNYKFVTLPLVNQKLSEDTVFCSQNVYDASTLLIVVHDTPDIWAARNVITGTIEPSSSIIVDSGLQFIKWAVKRNYGVMDINIPQSLFEQDNYSAMITAQEVLLYLWDNYIKFSTDVQKIAFVGIGDASSGIIHLMGHRDTRNNVKAIISFIGSKQLKPLVPLVDESLTDWYFKNSLVFSDKNHSCWGDNENKKPRKKYGRVLRCETDGINNIVEERFEEATDFILDSFEEWSDSE